MIFQAKTQANIFLLNSLPVLPEPRAVLGLVAAEPAASLVHALEVRQHGRAVVGREPAFCKHILITVDSG